MAVRACCYRLDSMETETQVWQEALPQACLQAVQADAAALADCPNFWVPREVVEGRAPALAAAEQVVQALHARLVAARLAPHDASFAGAEYWCQVYEGGRGLGFHFDKDEHAMKEEGRMANPVLSSVYYATGGRPAQPEAAAAAPAAASSSSGGQEGQEEQEDGEEPRQAPTVLIDQWYDHEVGGVQPEHPAWCSLVFPRANQYCLFGGCQAHGVLEGPPAEPGAGASALRVAFLVNWWARQPAAVARASADDVAAGRLAPARPELEAASLDAEAAGGKAAAPRPVRFVCLVAPPLDVTEEGAVLPVDALLEAAGVRLRGAGAVDAVTIRHPGLTLFPLDEEQVDPATGLQVMAALAPLDDGSSEGE